MVSCINGCVYCASVHAQRFEQLTKRNAVIAQVFENPQLAGTTAREKALVQFAIALTEAPNQLGAERLQALRATGVTVIVMAHRAGALVAIDRLMVLEDGQVVLSPLSTEQPMSMLAPHAAAGSEALAAMAARPVPTDVWNLRTASD